jgi:hypothetical protein
VDHADGDVDGADLDSGVDGDTREGMEEPSRGDSANVSPLQYSPAAAGRLSISVFSISPLAPFVTRRGTLYSKF